MKPFMVLKESGGRWGIPYREPYAGPFDTEAEALQEIADYRKQWPDDAITFGVFECLLLKADKP